MHRGQSAILRNMSQNPINHNEKLFFTIELVIKIFFIWSIDSLENFLKLFEKNHLRFWHISLKENRLKNPLRKSLRKSWSDPKFSKFFVEKPIMIMGWKVIWDVLFQFLTLIWPPDQPLARFSIFEKKVAKILILAKNGQ